MSTHKSVQKRFDKADAKAAINLKRIFEERRRTDPRIPTIADLATLYGCSRSMMSQYINGITAIGPLATLRLAHILRVHPTDIRPDFEFAAATGDLPAEAVSFALDYLALDAESRKLVQQMVCKLHHSD